MPKHRVDDGWVEYLGSVWGGGGGGGRKRGVSLGRRHQVAAGELDGLLVSCLVGQSVTV